MKNFTIMATGPMPAMLAAIDALRNVGADIDDIDVCNDVAKDAAPAAQLGDPQTLHTPRTAQVLVGPDAVVVKPKVRRRKRGVTNRVYRAIWKAYHLPVGEGGLRNPNAKMLAQGINLHQNDGQDLTHPNVGSALSRLATLGLVVSDDPKHKPGRGWKVVGAAPVADETITQLAREKYQSQQPSQKNLI